MTPIGDLNVVWTIFTGLLVLAIGGWLFWLSNTTLQHAKEIVILKQNDEKRKEEMARLFAKLDNFGTDIKAQIKELGIDLKVETGKINLRVDNFMKSEIEALKDAFKSTK